MTESLTKTDLMLIRQVHGAVMEFRFPYLPAPKWQKRCQALAAKGLLEQRESGAVPADDWCRYVFCPTQAGIDAFNAAIKAAAG